MSYNQAAQFETTQFGMLPAYPSNPQQQNMSQFGVAQPQMPIGHLGFAQPQTTNGQLFGVAQPQMNGCQLGVAQPQMTGEQQLMLAQIASQQQELLARNAAGQAQFNNLLAQGIDARDRVNIINRMYGAPYVYPNLCNVFLHI